MHKMIFALAFGLTLSNSAQAAAPDIWKQCTVVSSTLCYTASCITDKKADISIYLASYTNNDGKAGGYYYRCAAAKGGGCHILEDFWVAHEPLGYTAWSSRSYSTVTRMSSDGQMTDVMTENKYVLISRGTCEDAPPPIITSRLPPKTK